MRQTFTLTLPGPDKHIGLLHIFTPMFTREFTLQAHLDDAIHGVLVVGQPKVGLCNPLDDKLVEELLAACE